MSDFQVSTEIALLKQKIAQMEARSESQDREIELLKDERNHMLKWGIGALGAGVLAMATWVLDLITRHLP